MVAYMQAADGTWSASIPRFRYPHMVPVVDASTVAPVQTADGTNNAVNNAEGQAVDGIWDGSTPAVTYEPLCHNYEEKEIEIRYPDTTSGRLGTPKFHLDRYVPSPEFVTGTWYITHTTMHSKRFLDKIPLCKDWAVTLTERPKKHLFDKIDGSHFDHKTEYYEVIKDALGQDKPVLKLLAKGKDRPEPGAAAAWTFRKKPRAWPWRPRWQVIAYSYHRNETDEAEDRERMKRGEPPKNKSITESTDLWWTGRSPNVFEGQNADGTWGGGQGPTMNIDEVPKCHRRERKKKKKGEEEAKKVRENKRRGQGIDETGDEIDPAADVEGRAADRGRADASQMQGLKHRPRPQLERGSADDGDVVQPDVPGNRLHMAKDMLAVPPHATLGAHGKYVESADEGAAPAVAPVVEAAKHPKKGKLATADMDRWTAPRAWRNDKPEELDVDTEKARRFQTVVFKGRYQEKSDDDWIIVYYDGLSVNPNPLYRDWRKGIEIYCRKREGLSQEVFEKVAAALLDHEFDVFREEARKLKPLPGHLKVPPRPDEGVPMHREE